MPKKSRPKPPPVRKDFFYYLPLITSIVVNLFWGMFGLMLVVLAFASSLAGAFYYPETKIAYIPLAPLPLLLIIPITFLMVLFRYKKVGAYPIDDFRGINFLYLAALILGFLIAGYVFPSRFEGIGRSTYPSLMALAWLLSITLVGFCIYLSALSRRK